MKNITEALQWRYATKKFDATKKLTATQLDVLLEALALSPSSYGLQPWKFIIVTNNDVRTKLRAAAWGQPQITDASHLIVFAAKNNLSDDSVDEYIQSRIDTHGTEVKEVNDYRNAIKGMMQDMLAKLSPKERTEWAARQVYIALGILLSAAAMEGIDACPMEGFDPKQFDEILGLEKLGLESKVIATLGFRSESDSSAQLPKTRFPKEKLFIEVK